MGKGTPWKSLSDMKTSKSKRTLSFRLLLFVSSFSLAVSLSLSGCTKTRQSQASSDDSVGFPPSSQADCLPNLTLSDQYGKAVSLASLKGKPVLFDFIYTHCPGPCLLLTAQMRRIAEKLGPDLGRKVTFVSVTVDPEHDGPKQLLDYAKAQGADRDGWLFLTGPPATVDALMAQFNLQREHDEDGTIAHVLEFFLVGPNGRQIAQYTPHETKATALAADVLRVSGTD